MPNRPSPSQPDRHSRLKKRGAEFCDTVDINLVRDLASRCQNGDSCTVAPVGSHSHGFVGYRATFTDRGGYCLMVRIAIPTVHRNEWDIVRNEAATLEHVAQHTRVPVPQVYTYGTDERLTSDRSTTQSYIITNWMYGTRLSEDRLLHMTEGLRIFVLSKVGDVLAELQKLTFFNTGSLYYDRPGDMENYIGASLCRSDHGHKLRGRVVRRYPVTAAWDSIQHHLTALSSSPDMTAIKKETNPTEEIADGIFVKKVVKRYVTKKDYSFWRQNAPFMLNQGSLTIDRFLVNDGGGLEGVIDWSFSEILPRQLCQPPNWIFYPGPSPEDKKLTTIQRDFLAAIEPDHGYSKPLQYYRRHQRHMGVAAILRDPNSLSSIYFKYEVHKAVRPEYRSELDMRITGQKQKVYDIIARHADALAPEVDKLQKLCQKIQELISVAYNVGLDIQNPVPDPPVHDILARDARALESDLNNLHELCQKLQWLISGVSQERLYIQDPLSVPPMSADFFGNSPAPSPHDAGILEDAA